MNRYSYCIVRYVPDLSHGEFVNVGVVAACDATREVDLESRLPTQTRLNQIGGSAKAVGQFLMPLQDLIDRAASITTSNELNVEGRLVDLSQDRRSAIQLSRPLPLLAESFQDVRDAVSRRTFPAVARQAPELTRRDVKLAMMAALVKAHVRMQ